jgi:regulator of nucleoside diphosphate kinase
MVDNALPFPPITVTTADATRLRGLIGTRVGLAYRLEARRLRDELGRANVVAPDTVPSSLVTMNSKVRYADLVTREVKEVPLVYPWHAQGPTALSILSAVGTALLGMRIGDTIALALDDLSMRTFRVLAIPYQPEAAGHWHL